MRLGSIACMLLFAGHISAQTVSQIIVQRERAHAEAIRTDKAAAFYLETYTGIEPSGRFVAFTPKTSSDATFSLEDEIEVNAYEMTAVATGVERAGNSERPVRFARVWVKTDDGWKVAASHATQIRTAGDRVTLSFATRTKAVPAFPSWRGEEAQVLAAQRALNDTFAQRDLATYGKFTAPEFVRIDGNGQVIRRELFLTNNLAGPAGPAGRRLPSFNEDMKIRLYGNVAVLTWTNVQPRPDGTVGSPEAMTRIFVKREGLWQQVLTQTTFVSSAIVH